MSIEFQNIIKSTKGKTLTEEEAAEIYANTTNEYKKWVKEADFVKFICTNKESILWEDYETWGTNPQYDEASQYAAVRTNMDLEIIDVPLNIFCKPSKFRIPHPLSVEVTKLSPLHCEKNGLVESEFANIIFLEKSVPKTCSSAYNGINFDTNVSRYLFHRNLLPAYETEFKNGNAVWDILMVGALYRAIRPDGINWPTNDEGKPSLRLEDLCKANGIIQENPHEALSDVLGLIGFAKLLKSKQPKMWEFMYRNKSKKEIGNYIKFRSKIYLYCSMFFGNENLYTKPIIPLMHARNEKNSIIAIDLTKPIDDYLKLTPTELNKLIYSSKKELEEKGIDRPPIIKIKLNKCPAITTAGALNEESTQRLNINQKQVLANARKVLSNSAFINKIDEAYTIEKENEKPTNPEAQLYGFNFYSKSDTAKIGQILRDGIQFGLKKPVIWEDSRPHELLKRIIYKSYPEYLPDTFKSEMEETRKTALYENNEITPDNYIQESDQITDPKLKEEYINFVKSML
ncbi:exodeoxyribonuclease I [Pseudoalteromonas marina]|uniref:Exodeoxyribonuclease I n=1 Tax=Pseudoalteromonas marina TaxID=267375 RepID=A0ABT9FC55_9GAMM|nr:exodeoxyribonuclease I [Pseudoalteromonas marina]MDP2564368.1 exodeoxyribonuclease I [Pseudoalteromonas marina]